MNGTWRLRRTISSLRMWLSPTRLPRSVRSLGSNRREIMRICSERLNRYCRIIVLGLILSSLLGCSKSCPPCLRAHLSVPPNLVSPTPIPEAQGDDNAALLKWALDLRESLKSCNKDKEAISNHTSGE